MNAFEKMKTTHINADTLFLAHLSLMKRYYTFVPILGRSFLYL